MTLDQALNEATKAAERIERAVADSKAGYSDVLRQVMHHSTALTELRTEVRENEKTAQARHDELLEAIAKLGGNRG